MAAKSIAELKTSYGRRDRRRREHQREDTLRHLVERLVRRRARRRAVRAVAASGLIVVGVAAGAAVLLDLNLV